MGRVTIKDLAKAAGVSISTVSNALNDVDVLTPETKEHVLKVAKELNYRPNLRGKNLKSQKTNMIGFFTKSVSGPYFHTLLEAMARKSESMGYGLNVFISSDRNVILDNLFSGPIDGAIVFEYDFMEEKEIELIKKEKIKTVFMDREERTKNIGSILFDSYSSAYEATSYLINLGHKKIVFIAGLDDTFDSTQRKNGYIDALKDHGIKINPEYIIQGFLVEEGGYKAVKSFMRKYPGEFPEAFLAANDQSAIGCIKALESDGYQVPEDMSVMGFDDIEIAKYHDPSITTVRNQISRKGSLAAEHLINIIENKTEGKVFELPGSIIGRKSTAVRF